MSTDKGFQAGIEIVGKERIEVHQTIQKTHLGRGLSNIVQHGAALIETIVSTLVDNVNSEVTLPGNSALKGHILQNKTTGFEFNVIAVNADIITLEVKKNLTVIGTTGDEFAVKQFVMSQLNADGAMDVVATQGPAKFILDSVDTVVTEDTVDPTNNTPNPSKMFIQKDGVVYPVNKDTVDPNNTIGMPVEIVGADGAVINITAGDINVQTSHTGANPDSMRIGDGTNLLAVNANLEAEVHDNDLNAATGTIADAPVTNPALDASVIAALKGILTGINSSNAEKPNVLLSELCGIITPVGLALGAIVSEGSQINIGNNGDNLSVECDGTVVATSVAGQAITLNVVCPVGNVVVKSLTGSDIGANSVAITITE